MTLTYYTDGACSGNPGPGGFGVVRVAKQLIDEKEQNWIAELWSEQCEYTTNNREELKAILWVLDHADFDNYNYEIYSDSAYAVNICNDWMWKWFIHDWTRAKGKPIENLDLVKRLYNIISENWFSIHIRKCGGHAGIIENELADALATNNMTKFEKLKKDNLIL